MEYQADRGATVLDANPLALITALRKIRAVQKRSLKKAWAPHDIPKTNHITSIWNQQFSTHPTLERRIKRLVAIAEEKGFSQHDIKRATTDAIIIPDKVNISDEQIIAMAQNFIGKNSYEESNDNSENKVFIFSKVHNKASPLIIEANKIIVNNI